MPKTADEIRQEVERLSHEAAAAYANSKRRSWAEGYNRGMLHALLQISLFIDADLEIGTTPDRGQNTVTLTGDVTIATIGHLTPNPGQWQRKTDA